MTIFKICTFILFYFVARASMAGTCERFTGLTMTDELCWHDTYQGFVTEKCLKENCEALKVLKEKKKVQVRAPQGGQNPASLVCHALKQSVIILRDQRGNEQSFCQFGDRSIVDVNALERALR